MKQLVSDSSDTLRILLDINRPNGSFVDVYHKTGNTAGTFDTGSWVAMTPDGNNGQVAYSDGTTYQETSFNATVAPFTGEKFSQPVKELFPQTSRDNPVSDPDPA